MPVTVQLIGAWSWASVTTLSPAWMWPLTLSTVSGSAFPSSSAAESVTPSSPSRARRRRRRPDCPADWGRSSSSCRGRSRGTSPSRRTWPVCASRTTAEARVVAPSLQAAPSRWSVTYCRSWSRVSFTVSPSVAGVDSSMPEGIGLPPLPTSTRRWPLVPASCVLELPLDAGETGAVAADEADDLAADRAGRVQPHGVVLEGDAGQFRARRWRRSSPAATLRGQDDVAAVLRQLRGQFRLGDAEQRGQRPGRPRPCG